MGDVKEKGIFLFEERKGIFEGKKDGEHKKEFEK